MTTDHATTASNPPAATVPPALSCSTICFRDRPLDDALDALLAAGFTSGDLGALQGLCEHVPPFGSAEDLRAVSAVVKRSGFTPTSVNADCGSFTDDPFDTVLAAVARLSDFCADTEVPMLLLPCGGPERHDMPVDAQISLLARGLAAAADVTDAAGIQLVVEAPHHFRLVNTLARTRELLAQLDPRIRLVYDVSHVRAAGNDAANHFAEFADRVAHLHLRDAIDGDIRRCIGAGEIDFPAVFTAAAAAGYSGSYCLELETHDSPFPSKDAEVADALTRLGPHVPTPTV